MASSAQDTFDNGTVSYDSEGDMDDSSVEREYSIETSNGFGLLS